MKKINHLILFFYFFAIQLMNAQWFNSGSNVYLNAGSKAGMGTTAPIHPIHIKNGSLLLDVSSATNGNDGIIFRDPGFNTTTWGNWGIQYWNSGLNFWKPGGLAGGGDGNYALFLRDNGNVGIGVNPSSYKLEVCGTIRAKEIRVETGWCDYVFEPTYQLRPLNEVEMFLKAYKHLPEIPSQKIVETEGLKVGEMQALHMKKIEELTLYVIQLHKTNEALLKRVEQLETGSKK